MNDRESYQFDLQKFSEELKECAKTEQEPYKTEILNFLTEFEQLYNNFIAVLIIFCRPYVSSYEGISAPLETHT